MNGVALSSVRIAPACGIVRDCPRPPAWRNATFASDYDWDTLFYDVYRAGPYVVLQGPPFFNLLDHLKTTAPLRRAFGFPRFAARHIGTHKRGEIWLKSAASEIELDCALGHLKVTVQPDMAAMFTGKRVLTTISKNNELRWLQDWVAFYARNHGAQGVLLYDNGSTIYSAAEAEAFLRAAFPDLIIVVINWPFRFGPQGGMAGAVNGIETDWDSDFAQIGSLQHARHRFLRGAASVLNVDIDEMVLPIAPIGIFAATEASAKAMIHFPGRWISTAAAPGVSAETCRHADFTRLMLPPDNECPPKWCIVPGRGDRLTHSWSIHNVFGARGNGHWSEEFSFRHMRGITKSWKEDRWATDGADPAALPHDAALAAAFAAAGLERSGATA